ncbi:MAG TPA: hypothetical protein VM597_04160 [Gemmataceae bacterium]|nr:hypothetical protein [Gemmataceae bacterium]
MNGFTLWPLLLPIAGLLLFLGTWWLYRLGREVQTERAREAFKLSRERLTDVFLHAAAATGKPRGLRWVSCQFTDDFTLVRDRKTRKLAALIPVTIQFEPEAGGEMEDVPAANVPRPATAVFHFRRGDWVSEGQALFNVTPENVVSLFGKNYEPVGAFGTEVGSHDRIEPRA